MEISTDIMKDQMSMMKIYIEMAEEDAAVKQMLRNMHLQIGKYLTEESE